MRITIASLGRAHLLDAARELENRGYNVTFYSATPPSNFKRYGLKNGGISLIIFVFPIYLIKKYFHNYYTQRLYSDILDILVYLLLKRCDIFICQSPNFQRSMKKAKRLGAITILDRGTSHIDVYENLAKISKEPQHCASYVKYDKRQYDEADYITIASDFVEQGFLEKGFEKRKIFINPYGVSLKNFHPTVCTNEYDCIVVGQWSLRKGSHIIVDAFKNTNIKILHVGSIYNCEFPKLNNFIHVDPVKEPELIKYYSKAKVFLFPSIEDGFGLVLLQAAACGLPIIASTNCGASTLKRIISDKSYIQIIKNLTPETLKSAVYKMLENHDNGLRIYSSNINNILSWEQYGRRLDNFIKTIIHEKDIDNMQ